MGSIKVTNMRMVMITREDRNIIIVIVIGLLITIMSALANMFYL